MTDWKPAMRVPDPAVRVLDERFRPYVLPLAKLERLATGCRWCEGPVWFGDGRFLLWSDIPNNRILKWGEETGTVSAFRAPSLWSARLRRRTRKPPSVRLARALSITFPNSCRPVPWKSITFVPTSSRRSGLQHWLADRVFAVAALKNLLARPGLRNGPMSSQLPPSSLLELPPAAPRLSKGFCLFFPGI